LSHSLQYCGHFIPAGTLPAALSAFQSWPQARSRAYSAWRPSFGLLAVAGLAIVVAGAAAGDDRVAQLMKRRRIKGSCALEGFKPGQADEVGTGPIISFARRRF